MLRILRCSQGVVVVWRRWCFGGWGGGCGRPTDRPTVRPSEPWTQCLGNACRLRSLIDWSPKGCRCSRQTARLPAIPPIVKARSRRGVRHAHGGIYRKHMQRSWWHLHPTLHHSFDSSAWTKEGVCVCVETETFFSVPTSAASNQHWGPSLQHFI